MYSFMKMFYGLNVVLSGHKLITYVHAVSKQPTAILDRLVLQTVKCGMDTATGFGKYVCTVKGVYIMF